MQANKNFVNLDKILLNHHYVLFDTCGLTRFLPFNRAGSTTKYEYEFAKILQDKLNKRENIYVTPSVVDEYLNCKILDKPTSLADRVRPEIRSYIVALFEAKNRIVSFSKNLIVYRTCLDKMSKVPSFSKVEDTDKDILITGFILSRKAPAAIITNDCGISKAGKDMLSIRGISRFDLGIYKRRGINFYEAWDNQTISDKIIEIVPYLSRKVV